MPPLLVIGQGLAGTLLAWELERNGADFEIIDAPAAAAERFGGQASRVAAGMINPITGQRLAKTWRVDELLPLARQTYREMERALGVSLWHEMRVRRFFRDARERTIFAERSARGEFGSYVREPADEDGFWIEGAARVDVPRLLETTRRRWITQGRLREEIAEISALSARYELVVLCTGAGLTMTPMTRAAPWALAKGETLTATVDGLDATMILNRGHWVLPVAPRTAKIGATFEIVTNLGDELTSPQPSIDARAALERSGRELLARPPLITAHEAGYRVALPDKRPVAGRLPTATHVGVCGALGSKGALFAPWLARQWWNHLSEGVPFEAAIDVGG